MAVSVFLTSLTIALVIGVDPHKTLTAADLWRFGLGISVTAPALICPAVSLRTAKVLQRMRKAHAELVDLAEKDTLTGLLNRRGFDAAAASVLAEARRLSQPITALMCDIDMFKDINDKYSEMSPWSVLPKPFARQSEIAPPFSAGRAEMNSRSFYRALTPKKLPI